MNFYIMVHIEKGYSSFSCYIEVDNIVIFGFETTRQKLVLIGESLSEPHIDKIDVMYYGTSITHAPLSRACRLAVRGGEGM